MKPESMLSSCKEVMNHLLETYATNDVISETEMNMQNYQQPLHMTPTQYAEALWSKALRCNQMNTENTLKGIFVEGPLIRFPTAWVRTGVTIRARRSIIWRDILLLSRLSKERRNRRKL